METVVIWLQNIVTTYWIGGLVVVIMQLSFFGFLRLAETLITVEGADNYAEIKVDDVMSSTKPAATNSLMESEADADAAQELEHSLVRDKRESGQ